MGEAKTVIQVLKGVIQNFGGNSLHPDGTLKPIVIEENKTLIGRRAPPHASLERFKDLSNTSKVEFNVMNPKGKVVKVVLPNNMIKRLAKYVSEEGYPFDQGFDCISFVHYMFGEDYTYKSPIDWNRFSYTPVEKANKLKSGDVVLGSINKNNKQIFVHAMIYIGEELFLSKLGTDRISVQNLKQIEQIYGKLHLAIMKRK